MYREREDGEIDEVARNESGGEVDMIGSMMSAFKDGDVGEVWATSTP